jgi:transcriptional regulator with XRE-family HTH domain
MTCNLKTIRLALGMTQREIAAVFGQTPSNVSHYENGKQELPPSCARALIDAAQGRGHNLTFDDIYTVEKVSSGGTPPEERQAA